MSKMKKAATSVAAIILCGALIGPAIGQQKPGGTGAVAARKANFKEIGGAFKTVNDEIRSGRPDMNALKPAARDLATRSRLSLGHFPRDSAPGPGITTRAKADIWANMPAFVKLQNMMVNASASLDAAVSRGDVGAMTKARDALGATCKACHDRFRQPS